jgi:large subunit ribosomal protein L4
MSTLKVVDREGKEVGKVEVAEKFDRVRLNKHLVYEVAVAYERNRRQGTASTKNRARVRGGGTKPWRQKGTGRARAGSRTSPLWRGGGVVFGPSPRDFSRTIPKKMRKKALKKMRKKALMGLLGEKLRTGDVVVVDKFELEGPKTKCAADWLKKIDAGRKPLIILSNEAGELRRAFRNIKDIGITSVECLNAHNLLSNGKMIITQDDFQRLQERAS